MRFVDVTNDIAFRKIFGNENKKKALISFLNAVIDLPNAVKITEVTILNPYQLPNLSDGKSTIIDVKAKDHLGNSFIVEMQVAEADFFHKRILYYTSQSYVSQIGAGKEYNKLQPAYFIGILAFDVGKNPNYFSRHKVLDVETGEHIIQDVEFYFIELKKFDKELAALTTSIDQWTFFIKNALNLEIIPDNVSDDGLKEAYNEAAKHNWSQKEYDEYERASIREGDLINIAALIEKRAEQRGMERGIERGIEQGIEQGIERGIRQGIQQGIQQGIEQGVEEGKLKEKLDSITKALKRGKLSEEEIAEDFDVTIDFVKAMKLKK
ncbi:MAG: Rpn family recombination-promoting nuclease/putative transposase [Cytophagales bacterium]